jgi:putative endonuclease
MTKQHNYWTYIMASLSRVMYVGVTNDLERRVWEHKQKQGGVCTKRYNCTKLVWFEEFREIRDAIACEKRIKGLLRARKIALIEEKNQHWKDLSEGWYREAERKNEKNDRDSSLRSE